MITVNDFDKKQILFVFLSSGEKISFSNDNIVVKNSDGSIKHQSTCYRLFALFVVGHMTVTTGLIQRSHRFGFLIFFMTPSLKLYDMLGGENAGNVLLRRHQYEYNDVTIAKHLIHNKISNQIKTIGSIRSLNNQQQEAVEHLKDILKGVSVYKGDNIHYLMGQEGCAARIYFSNYFVGMNWHGRMPRLKCDYINSTLDIGYTILFNFIEALLNVYGFDIYCGVLHRQFYMRKSLVCDLVEPFRCLIDRQIRKSINLCQIRESDFNEIDGRFLLKWENNALYVRLLLQPILANKTVIFRYIQSYYRAFMKNKPIDEYPYFDVGTV